MKALFISDIHGHADNIKHIEKIIEEKKIDKLFILGDIFLGGYDIHEIYEFLNKYKSIITCMKGNCDFDNDLPVKLEDGIKGIMLDDVKAYITHGHMLPFYKDIYEGNILIYGHKHVPSIETINNTTYINVGSISKPRDGKLPTYMLYENHEFIIFDINDVVRYKIYVK